ncbi:flippase, partial [Methanocrinis sp.]|uniref:flippase n=1 Tax=Methanocrinis sp. TaxID=3101522 RepID=UPI003D0CD901
MVQLAKTVLRNSAYNFLGVFATTFGGLIFSVILARMLGSELFGLYHLALSVGLFFLTFTTLGLHSVLIRYVSDALGRKDEDLARGYIRYITKIKVVLTIFTTLILLLLAKPLALYFFHKPEVYLPLIFIAIYILFQSSLDFVASLSISVQRFDFMTARYISYEVARIIIIPSLIFLGFGIYGALAGLIISVLLALVVAVILICKDYTFLFKGAALEVDRPRVLRFLSYLTLGSVSGVIFTYIDSIMLGMFMPVESVGFYRIAISIIFAILSLVSISQVLFPTFTQLQDAEVRDAFNKLFRYSSMLSFPSALGLIFLSEPLIRMVYGSEYLPAVLPTRILALLIIIFPFSYFGTLFNAREMPEYPAKLVVVSSSINIILNYVLILEYGIMGAAIATLISRCFNSIGLGYLSGRVFGIYPVWNVMYKPLISSMAMYLLISLLPGPSGIVSMLGLVALGAAVYVLVMYAIKGADKDDLIYLSRATGQEKRLAGLFKFLRINIREMEK